MQVLQSQNLREVAIPSLTVRIHLPRYHACLSLSRLALLTKPPEGKSVHIKSSEEGNRDKGLRRLFFAHFFSFDPFFLLRVN